jgi:hypothetical protein
MAGRGVPPGMAGGGKLDGRTAAGGAAIPAGGAGGIVGVVGAPRGGSARGAGGGIGTLATGAGAGGAGGVGAGTLIMLEARAAGTGETGALPIAAPEPAPVDAAARGSPSRPTANTALQTLQRARTPPSGILAGSTR